MGKQHTMPTIHDCRSPWRSREFFSHRERLEKNCQQLLKLPTLFKDTGFLSLGLFSYTGDKSPDMWQVPDSTDLLITGILAAGKSMTLPQLNSYLLLQGIALPEEELEQRVSHMLEYGQLMRITIYQKGHFLLTQGDFAPEHIDCYQVSPDRAWLAGQIFAPQDFAAIQHGFTKTPSALLYFYISSILWNQIVLNFLLHSPTFQHFEIFLSHYLPDYGRLTVPLCIKTEDGNYIFHYITVASERKMHLIFDTWMSCQNHSKEKNTFVLIAKNTQELFKAKCWIARENFFHGNIDIGAFFPEISSYKPTVPILKSVADTVKDTIPTEHIAFSLAQSWFSDGAGILIPYNAPPKA